MIANYLRLTTRVALGQLAGGLIIAVATVVAAAAPTAYQLAPIRGQVVDQITYLPLEGAIVNAAWILETDADAQAAGINYLYIQQVGSDKEGRFVVTTPEKPLQVEGYKLKVGSDPLITIYAAGHRSLLLENGSRDKSGHFNPFNLPGTNALKCQWNGKVMPLNMLDGGPSGTVLTEELSAWRDNLEITLNATSWHGNKGAALENQQLLLNLIRQECGLLTEDQRKQVCTGSLSPPDHAQAPDPAGETVIKVIQIQPPAGHGSGNKPLK